MKALLLVLFGIVLCSLPLQTAFAQQPQFTPQPAAAPFAVPVQPYATYQLYQTGPVGYVPMRPYPYTRPRVAPYPPPRGVWGWGPFVMGYYW